MRTDTRHCAIGDAVDPRDARVENGYIQYITTIVAAVLSLASLVHSAPANKFPAEMRGVWLHLPESTSDRKDIDEMVGRLADANFNLILPWVVSEYAAKATGGLGAQGSGWRDVLGEVVDAANRRGIAVHMWYSFTYYKSPQSPEFSPVHGGDANWAAISISDRQKGSQSMTDVCPVRPNARKWEIALIMKVMARYPYISGVHIEEPGYGYSGNCVCDACRALYHTISGRTLDADISSERAEDFRCIGTTEFIREFREEVGGRSPRIYLSVNGGTSWKQDRALGRDWKYWAEKGWLDFYVSQNYTPNVEIFAKRLSVMAEMKPLCPTFIGIGIKWSGGEVSVPVMLRQIELARAQGGAGVVIFCAGVLGDAYLTALRNGPFESRADLPFVKR